MTLDAKQEDVTKFSSCSDAGFCCKPGAITTPELIRALAPILITVPCPVSLLQGGHTGSIPIFSGSSEAWFRIPKPIGTL